MGCHRGIDTYRLHMGCSGGITYYTWDAIEVLIHIDNTWDAMEVLIHIDNTWDAIEVLIHIDYTWDAMEVLLTTHGMPWRY